MNFHTTHTSQPSLRGSANYETISSNVNDRGNPNVKSRASSSSQMFLFVAMILVSQMGWGQWQPNDPTQSGNIFYNGGNVGIGATSPNHKLEVRSGADSPLVYIRQDQNSGGSNDVFFLRDDRGYAGINSGTTFKVESWRGANQLGGTLANFITIFDGVPTSRLYLSNENGYVGVGTTTPQANIDLRRNDASMHITAANATAGGVGHPYLYINRISEGLKLEYVPNVLARISNTYNGSAGNLALATSGHDRLFITGSGNVGIGSTNPTSKLTVKGRVHAEEVKVDLSVPGPDYVFEESYHLQSLEEIESYIKQNKHLPEVPTALQMEKEGIKVGEMNMLLLKKVEEITLHLIELKKENENLKSRVKSLEQID